MSGRVDAAMLLERALIADARRAGVVADVGAVSARRWASATFVGARHRLTVDGAIGSAREWLDALPEADLPLRGHLVADIVVTESRCDGDRFYAMLEALTVEEA